MPQRVPSGKGDEKKGSKKFPVSSRRKKLAPEEEEEEPILARKPTDPIGLVMLIMTTAILLGAIHMPWKALDEGYMDSKRYIERTDPENPRYDDYLKWTPEGEEEEVAESLAMHDTRLFFGDDEYWVYIGQYVHVDDKKLYEKLQKTVDLAAYYKDRWTERDHFLVHQGAGGKAPPLPKIKRGEGEGEPEKKPEEKPKEKPKEGSE